MSGLTTRGRVPLLVAAGLLAAAGCGTGRYPVTGRVVYEDGTPLPEGTVVGEMGDGATRVMAQGAVRPDGTFEWGTERPGDGAPPGRYRVIVLPRALGDAEEAQGMQPAVDEKFSSYETSGVAFEVTNGRNEFTITVSRPPPRKK